LKANDESIKDVEITTQNLYNIGTGAGPLITQVSFKFLTRSYLKIGSINSLITRLKLWS